MERNWLIIILSLLILNGCTGERCIEADDFGHAIFTVSARYNKEELNGQVGETQVAPWRDSTYRVNGRPLTITVKGWENGIDYNTSWELSAWCAWYGTSHDSEQLANFCTRFPECRFIDGIMCTNTADARIMNAPCLFRNGVGLYALIAEKSTDPNQSLDSQRDPRGISFHLGEKQAGYFLYEVDKLGNTREVGGRVYQYESDAVKQQYNDSKLYFKILDKFYDDNSGQYRVVVKSGITRTDPDPISYVTRLVKEFLFGVGGNDYGLIRSIYLGIVNNPGYRMVVSALLTLYIMYTGLSYLAGNIELTQTELIVRITKIAIVSALLSTEYSWSFFNDYLFAYFIGGVEQILQLIVEAGATGPGSPDILGLMMAPQTVAKLVSLLFVDWLGFVYIILFFFVLYFVLMIFFQAAVIYLTALIAIGMIITMGPIFICFMLFEITKPLFENWLKQLISYALQPIILFTGLIFISLILRQEIYGALGFRVCKYDFPMMTNTGGVGTSLFGDITKETLGYSLGDSIFYWWFPQPMKGNQFSKETRPIPIPIDHFEDESITGSVSDTGFCEAYACVGDRYIDLPFLDPQKDVRRLTQFWNGHFVQFDGLLLIFVAVYLLHKFNGLTVSIARFITGTSGNFTNISNVGDAVKAQTFDKLNKQLKSLPKRAAVGAVDKVIGKERRQALVKSAKAALSKVSPSALIDKARVKILKKEALSSRANKAVLSEVKRGTGLSQSNVKKGAIKNYKEALKKELLKDVDQNLPQFKREKIANDAAAKLSRKKFANLKEEFAKLKLGKEYSKLSPEEKSRIDSVVNSRKLRTLAKESSEARRFKEAYVDAYANLSNKGVGIVGKHSQALRSLEEIKFDAKQRKELKEIERKQFGDELFSGYGRIKGSNIDPSTDNYRKQTYAEILDDRRNEITKARLTKTIDDYNKRYGTSVISPEFLSNAELRRDPNLSTFRNLEREDLNGKVYNFLSSSEDPAILGNSYLSQYAKDSEMRHAIDRAYELEKSFGDNDQFISRGEDYQLAFDVASEVIEKDYKELSSYYNRSDIKADEMPSLLQRYYNESGASMTQNEAVERVEELKQSIKDFNEAQQVLKQIDIRKKEVSEEVGKYVDNVNGYRAKAQMHEYRPEKEEIKIRTVRKIDDYLRNK